MELFRSVAGFSLTLKLTSSHWFRSFMLRTQLSKRNGKGQHPLVRRLPNEMRQLSLPSRRIPRYLSLTSIEWEVLTDKLLPLPRFRSLEWPLQRPDISWCRAETKPRLLYILLHSSTFTLEKPSSTALWVANACRHSYDFKLQSRGDGKEDLSVQRVGTSADLKDG